MGKVGFTILFFFFLLFAAILAYVSDLGFLIMVSIIGLILLLFPSFISKNLVMWFQGVSLFITPKSGRKNPPWYTPQEFFGDNGGKIFTRIAGLFILIVGILFYIFLR